MKDPSWQARIYKRDIGRRLGDCMMIALDLDTLMATRRRTKCYSEPSQERNRLRASFMRRTKPRKDMINLDQLMQRHQYEQEINLGMRRNSTQ